MLEGTYNLTLVALSYVVAALASFVALDISGRINSNPGTPGRGWLWAGGAAMGLGIWSMHFIGMLAFRLPIPLGYDMAITLYSLAVAVAASTYALWLVSREHLPAIRLAGGALILGAGIALMHYTGMAAMRMQPGIDYDPFWFALSIVIAIAAAGAALLIAYHLRIDGVRTRRIRLLAAAVMGIAVVGMHYTGMAAARFPVGSICGAAFEGGVSQPWLASLIGVSSFALLGLAVVVSVLDRRMQERTAVLNDSLHRANEELTYLALHDPLTRLPNRALLEDRLEQAIEKGQRNRTRFALMFVDLDGFKAINDAYGHPIGDRLLVQMAHGIRDVVRAEDTVARLGGDEFIVLMELNEPEDAATVAEKLLAQAALPLETAQGPIRIGASIGIALYPEDATHARELMANADAAMYTAKEHGRNGYRFFEPSMNEGVHESVALSQDLRAALTRNELYLDFQPKLAAPNGPLQGVEALLRWRHPRLGLVMPERFVPLAEKHGLIVEIGRWVLDESCRQLAGWRVEGRSVPNVSVNLSAHQLHCPSLVHDVEAALRRHALAPGMLTLEVTETTAMADPEHSLRVLQALADVGVHISIDDFGTGYSSLMYLKRLPAVELKIDRGFITDLRPGSDDAAIVASIIALGRTLDMVVVAEGVETRAQQELLTQLGCNSLQGYYLCRPVAPARVRLDGYPTGHEADPDSGSLLPPDLSPQPA